MKINLAQLSPDLLTLISVVAQEADRRNIPVYLVGGFVRDLLLKRPNEDLDFVVEGDALDLAKAVAKKVKGAPVFHKMFGTATIALGTGVRLDFVTARKEVYPHPGALPVVSRGTLAEDLFRRDFTINAMAVAINARCRGELVDFYGGCQDLAAGRIRVLHSKSFRDDPTRIIRAVRFEQRFDFLIETATLRFLRQALRQGAVNTVKPPRYFDAFRKVFYEGQPARCFVRMKQLRVLDFLSNSVSLDKGLILFVEENIMALRKEKIGLLAPWALVYFLVLASALGRTDRRRISEVFQLSRDERSVLLSQEQLLVAERRLRSPGLKPSQVYVMVSTLPESAVWFLRVASRTRPVVKHLDRYLRYSRAVKVQMSGKDLQAAGVLAGSRMGEILQQVLLRKIDGKIKKKSDEIVFVNKIS